MTPVDRGNAIHLFEGATTEGNQCSLPDQRVTTLDVGSNECFPDDLDNLQEEEDWDKEMMDIQAVATLVPQNENSRNSDNCETVSTVKLNTAVPAMNRADQDLSSSDDFYESYSETSSVEGGPRNESNVSDRSTTKIPPGLDNDMVGEENTSSQNGQRQTHESVSEGAPLVPPYSAYMSGNAIPSSTSPTNAPHSGNPTSTSPAFENLFGYSNAWPMMSMGFPFLTGPMPVAGLPGMYPAISAMPAAQVNGFPAQSEGVSGPLTMFPGMMPIMPMPMLQRYPATQNPGVVPTAAHVNGSNPSGS